MPKFNFLINLDREDAIGAALETNKWLTELSVDVGFDPESAQKLKKPSVSLESLGKADLVVTFGGDGTLIHAACYCSEMRTPILGVYFGRFGFVTKCDPKQVRKALTQFLDGHSEFDDRMMLKAELVRNRNTVADLHALNEITVQRSISTRMMFFGTRIDYQDITSYPADGVLVATPTGSTAYSLSAGGPIVDPRVEAMILTPITPHTLAARPLVLSPNSRVDLDVQVQGDAVVTADGRSRLNLLTGDSVVVTRSERITRLVEVDRADFLAKLRERLLWGARS